MKKLVVFAVALVAAVMSQAAALDWKYTTTADELDATVYIIAGSTAITEWDSADAVAAAALNSAAVLKKGKTNYAASGSFTSEQVTKSDASMYYVIVSADGSSFSVTSVANMTGSVYDPDAQESTPGSFADLTSANVTVSGKSFGSNPPPGPTPVDTPEPTSGLLLLVGGAALALRRKQK